MKTDQEIERKFKIDPTRFLRWLMTFPPPWKKTNIVQYYLAGDPQVRIRSVSGEYQMCFKYPTTDPVVRDEIEWEIPSEVTLKLTTRAIRVLVKERFRVEWCGQAWEVDCIPKEPDDVWVAEIELKSPTETINRPIWLREEVTGQPEYSSFALATPVK